MSGFHARASGYDDVAQNILKYCTPDKVMNKTYFDFECNAYSAGMAKQDHVPLMDLEMGATVTFPTYKPDYSLPRSGHWNNGEKDYIGVDLDQMSVNACNTYSFEHKVSQRDYQLLRKAGCYKDYTNMIGRALATRKKALLDSYAFAVAVGSAGLQIGSSGDPVTNTASAYNDMWKQIITDSLKTKQMCSIKDNTPDIMVYLPHDMIGAHIDFFDEKQSCACKDGIRMGLDAYTTPYGHQVSFVDDQFLPRDATTGKVLGLWLNRQHFGLVNQSFYEGWFPDRSDMWFEGEMLYDAFLLNCKAAGAIVTDVSPTCDITCA
jgi:hypothetical protein